MEIQLKAEHARWFLCILLVTGKAVLILVARRSTRSHKSSLRQHEISNLFQAFETLFIVTTSRKINQNLRLQSKKRWRFRSKHESHRPYWNDRDKTSCHRLKWPSNTRWQQWQEVMSAWAFVLEQVYLYDCQECFHHHSKWLDACILNCICHDFNYTQRLPHKFL